MTGYEPKRKWYPIPGEIGQWGIVDSKGSEIQFPITRDFAEYVCKIHNRSHAAEISLNETIKNAVERLDKKYGYDDRK